MANWEGCTVLKREYTKDQVNRARGKFEGVIKAQAPDTVDHTIDSFYEEPDAGAGAPKQVKSLDDITQTLDIPKPSQDQLDQLRGKKSGGEQNINITESANQYHAIEQARLEYLKVFDGYSQHNAPLDEQKQKIDASKNYLNRFAKAEEYIVDANNLLDNIKTASERTEHGFECTISKASNNQWTVSIPLTGHTHGQAGNSVIAGHLSRKLQRLAVSEGKTIDFTLPNRWMSDEKKMVISRRITQDTIREMLVAPKGVKPAIVEVNNNPYLRKYPNMEAAYNHLMEASKNQSYKEDGSLNITNEEIIKQLVKVIPKGVMQHCRTVARENLTAMLRHRQPNPLPELKSLAFNAYLAKNPGIKKAYDKVLKAKRQNPNENPELTKAEQQQLNQLFPESSISSKAQRYAKNLGKGVLAKISRGERGVNYTPSINPLITENTNVTLSPDPGVGMDLSFDPDGDTDFGGGATFVAAELDADHISGPPGRDTSTFNASMRSDTGASTIHSVSGNHDVLENIVAENVDALAVATNSAIDNAKQYAAPEPVRHNTDYGNPQAASRDSSIPGFGNGH